MWTKCTQIYTYLQFWNNLIGQLWTKLSVPITDNTKIGKRPINRVVYWCTLCGLGVQLNLDIFTLFKYLNMSTFEKTVVPLYR